ncbi:MAG TPA: arginyltransferase [Chthoniobacteraceae bacterium]|jgi:arginine-tRNA-protein transferase|nr:arginyltransferase [Chthoniobacteraceae bacterium]
MAVEHARFPTPEHPCAYLEGRPAMLDVRLLTDVSPQETEHLVERGWRRFGPEYFRPICRGCAACISLRVPVAQFRFSKSQRRVVRKCDAVKVEIANPRADAIRVALYRKWHTYREKACGWQENPLDEEGYRRQFCFPHSCGREMTYWIDGRLAGVGLVDEMPQSISSTYFFFDPDFARLSLGVYSALCEISLAIQLRKDFVYFGYRVDGCKSLMYKGGFHPHELLITRPGEGERAVWVDEEGLCV